MDLCQEAAADATRAAVLQGTERQEMYELCRDGAGETFLVWCIFILQDTVQAVPQQPSIQDHREQD